MKIIIFILLMPITCFSQQIGFVTGGTKQGINNPAHVQPIYGLTFQKQFGKYIMIETDCIYSQRMNGNKIQADYLSFMAMGKVGYFGDKAGIYGGYGFSLNPTINHTGGENHTYLSFIPSIGIQINIFSNTILEMKGIYDTALTPGYHKDGIWQQYGGIIIMGGIKYKLK